MFIQGYPTTKEDSVGALWLKVKKSKTYTESKENLLPYYEINQLKLSKNLITNKK